MGTVLANGPAFGYWPVQAQARRSAERLVGLDPKADFGEN
jgi:hypothetical protein